MKERTLLARALLLGQTSLEGLGPQELVLEITSRCNLRCSMCARTMHCQERQRQDLSLDRFERIVEHLGPGIERVAIAGLGEPCLHPKLPTMVNTLTKKGYPVVLYTNATLLTQELSTRLLDGGLKAVVFPIDGHSPEVYEQHRVGASYSAVHDNVKTFLEMRDELSSPCFVEVQMLALAGTRPQLRDFKAHWRKLGADSVRYKPDHMDAPNGPESQKGVCPMPWRGPATVDVFGQLLPCCVQDENNLVLGDLTKATLLELWNNDAATSLRRAFIQQRRKQKTCEGCNIPLPPRLVSAGGAMVSPFLARRILTRLERLLELLGGEK